MDGSLGIGTFNGKIGMVSSSLGGFVFVMINISCAKVNAEVVQSMFCC
jgi:hypothetical protein